ncbi:DJ-1/PfpI family protein [Bosea sp. 2YAB26]|uniref:DJ-1/PfpI family protein n=2 Tax=Pseudomonadota TaxID=1224 RepID=UPI003F91B75D
MTTDMTRRDLTALAATGALSGLFGHVRAAEAQPAATGSAPMRVAMLVHPDMVLLDLVGPLTVFSLLQAETHLVWKGRAAVTSDVKLPVTPTTTFSECPRDLDALFVPGGLKGSVTLMGDSEVLGFLAERGAQARYVTSVCTGSLLLGAAGLLKGYRATSHWYVRDLLPLMGAKLQTDRVVIDRNRMTGGGVTAGLDFGLTLAAALVGEETARHIQLVLEYDPQPPFDSGAPERADKTNVQDVLARRSPLIAMAKAQAEQARSRLAL